MSMYKVVFRADRTEGSQNQIAWEPGCPLIFDAAQISRHIETGAAFLQAKIRNISEDTVASFKSEITCKFTDGSKQHFTVEPLDADIPPGRYHEIRPVELPRGDVISAEACIKSAMMKSGEWKASGNALPSLERTPIDLSAEAKQERALQLEQLGCQMPDSAAAFAVEKHDGWTMCACGQPNVSTNTCVECGLNLADYGSALEDEDKLIQSVREKVAQAQKEEEERQYKKEQKKAKIKKVAPFIAFPTAIIATIALAIFVIAPSIRHHQAENLIRQGDYQAAIDMFREMGDTEGVARATKAQKEHDYQAACDLLESGSAEAALERFEALGDYRDSGQKAQDSQHAIDYDNAEILFKSGKYEEAQKGFSALGDYADSTDRAKESQYQWAKELFESGDKSSSARLFGKLGNYRDAKEKSAEAWGEAAVRETISAGRDRISSVKNDGTIAIATGHRTDNDLSEAAESWTGLTAVASGGVIVGLGNDGSVHYAHLSQYDSFDENPAWKDVVSVAATDDLVLGLKANGTIEADSYLFKDSDFKYWNDVIAISTCGNNTALGLRADGTVLVEGHLDLDFEDIDEIESWTDIVAIDGGIEGTVVGVKSDGTIVSAGFDGVYKDLGSWTDIVSVSVGDNVIAGLRSDGTVIVSHHKVYEAKEDVSVSGWADLVSVSAGDRYVVGLKSDGSVYYSSEDEGSKLQQAAEWEGVLVP